MRTAIGVAIFSLSLIAASMAPRPVYAKANGMVMNSAEAALRDTVVDWGRKWFERDAHGILAHYAPEAVLFVPGEPAAQGLSVFGPFIHEILGDPNFALAWAVDRATVSEDGGTGYVHGRYVQHNPRANGGGYTVETGHFVTTFRKEGAHWLAVAEINTPGPIASHDGLRPEMFSAADAAPRAEDDPAPASVLEAANLALIRRHILEFWQDGKAEIGPELYAPDFIDHNQAPGGGSGLAAITEVVRMMKAGFTEQKYEIVHLFAVGDLVVDHWVLRAKHTGEFAGCAPTNRRIEFAGSDIFRIRDGRIIDIWHTEEIARLMDQLTPEG